MLEVKLGALGSEKIWTKRNP